MRFLSKKDVRSLVSLSFASIDRHEAAGDFPTRVKLGFRVAWVEDEVLEWMQQRVLERQTTQTAP
jgi:prophage regulatory protein